MREKVRPWEELERMVLGVRAECEVEVEDLDYIFVGRER